MTHPPFSPPRAALRWEAGARRGCAHRERPLPDVRLGGWPADWGGSAAPGRMMLRRGPWPWRARLLQTPGTHGRTHPRPPMPQVKPEPGGGGGAKLGGGGWKSLRGATSAGAKARRPGRSLRFAGSPVSRAGGPRQVVAWAAEVGPGVQSRGHPQGPREGKARKERTCVASPRLSWGAGTMGLRPGEQHSYPGRQFLRVQTTVFCKFSEPFCCRLDRRCRNGRKELRKR